MSTDRYEIRGKIGQGGVGAVYRAYDTQLRREVAMKRVLQDGDMNSEDATANLLKEATALSSVQHPHIVTVYDAGIDAEGPYVVMELINGKTLDEMVERGTLTFEDFKEVAVQSQEAMIAAQDLNLVHRDLKPSNVMVSWLPSGRFQVKIVDFGLAKFSAKPSLQTIDHGDAVFGSIFFMAPEQFERTPLDCRTDMYSLGAMYYYALAGDYPFNGDTAPQVMAAHLQNKVPPLAEVRPDLPPWVCDWVMWHIRRDMNDRPESARTALEHFLAHDSAHTFGVTATQPLQAATPATQTTGQVLTAAPAGGQTAPQPILSPGGQANPHTAPQQTAPQLQTATPAPALAAATPAATATAVAQPTPAQEAPAPAEAETTPAFNTSKPKISTTKLVAIAVALAVIVTVIAILTAGRNSDNNTVKVYNELTEAFNKKADQADLQTLTKEQLSTLLTCYISQEKGSDGKFLYNKDECKAILLLSKAAESTLNIDLEIAEFATQNGVMDEELRKSLFSSVLKSRSANILKTRTDAHKKIYPWLKQNLDHESAPAAIEALSPMANDTYDFDEMLQIASKTSNPKLISQIGIALSGIIDRSSNKEKLASSIVKLKTTTNDDLKNMLIKVASHTGSKNALEMVKERLNSSKVSQVRSALSALQNWPNRDAVDVIVEKVRDIQPKDDTAKSLRKSGLIAASQILLNKKVAELPGNQAYWQKIIILAGTDKERQIIVGSLAGLNNDWVLPLLQSVKDESKGRLADWLQTEINKRQ